MKKRYLRPSIQWSLAILLIFQFIFMGVDDFEVTLTSVTLIVFNLLTMLINVYILKKYGKGIFKEDEER